MRQLQAAAGSLQVGGSLTAGTCSCAGLLVCSSSVAVHCKGCVRMHSSHVCVYCLPTLQALLTTLQLLALPSQQLGLQDGMLAAELLQAAAQDMQLQQQAPPQQQQHAGMQVFCQWATRQCASMSGQQQLQMLECLAAVSQAGIGACSIDAPCTCVQRGCCALLFPCPLCSLALAHLHRLPRRLMPAGPVLKTLQELLVTSLAAGGLLLQAGAFEAAAQALCDLHADQRSSGAITMLLGEPLLRKLFRDDADGGGQLLLEVLIGLHMAGVELPQPAQDAVVKVRQQLAAGRCCCCPAVCSVLHALPASRARPGLTMLPPARSLAPLPSACAQVLLEFLSRCSPPQLAALLACHTRLGLASRGKLLRRVGAELLRRPVIGSSAEMLLGVLQGLAAGGSSTVKELPQQLLTK